ncbi:MAG TPA: PQQ-dependent sugar dehydrogenase, partial [Pyrinomonadaceae bacterium]|nr:PQQ-dependent sugar dehydrogenase [Pyrinomonadaceae bacterium]
MYRKFLAAASLVAALVLCCVDFRTSVVPRAQAQGPGPLPSPTPQLALVSPVGGFSHPLGIVNAGDGSGRLFVVEKEGRVRIIKNGSLLPTPFLDISTRISTDGERGLLGLAFPPGFATSKRFYTYSTNPAGDIVIERYRVSAGNADVADPASQQFLITIPHPTNSNHNGGDLAFGADGFLYAGTGDGGAGNDPPNNAQNPSQLLGKILRLDVETGNPTTYTIPASNPFVTSTTFRHEIWAYGVRNPWRFTFDRQTHDLYIADVGQGAVEEVDFQPASDAGGENYGWRVWEGTSCTGLGPAACTTAGYTFPVVQYTHVAGRCSITGGYVYRGAAFPRMQGVYFYGDLCTGEIWGTKRDGSGAWVNSLLLDTPLTSLSTFGEDEAGNLYVADLGTGTIYRITDTTAPPPSASVNDVSVTEGNGGQTAATFTVTLSRAPDSAVTVNYHTSDGSATAPGDYQSVSSSVIINPGQTSANVSVQVNGDTSVEPDETFTLNLDGVSGPATLDDTQGVGTILNDDTAP